MSRHRLIGAALAVGVAALPVLLAAAFTTDPLLVLRGWLVAAHLCLGLALGGALLLLIHAVTGGRWGLAVGPALRAMAGTMPLAALAFLPLIWAAGDLFPWADMAPEELPGEVANKLAYLDVGFLQIRSLICLAAFIVIAWAAGAWSEGFASLGLVTAAFVVFAIAITVFTIDWLLAFEPEFYSTIYAALHGSGSVVAALAAGTFWLWAMGGKAARLEELAMLLLGWAMVWIYMVFMQYLVIWSGDLPVEIGWYLARSKGGWPVLLWVAALAHIIAVGAMSSPRLKKRPDAVAATAALLLLGQAADFWWRTAPAFDREGLLPGVLDMVAVAGLGGLWLAAALWAVPDRTEREAHHG